MAKKKDLEYFLAQARRIAAHREAGAERIIRKIYKHMLKELNTFISETYVQYAEDDKLTYAMLQKAGYDARFLEEVESHISIATPKTARELRELVEETYKIAYDGMVDAVNKGGNLDEAFMSSITTITPEQIKNTVNNPIMEIALEKNHRNVIYDIKQVVAVGLMNGDRYTTMARRISEKINSSYNKAIQIARTETHRVIEAGNIEAAENVDTELQSGTTGMRMVKTWKSMKDERVRPQVKRGKKIVMRGNANHVAMDGQVRLTDELFDLGNGVTAKAPGQSGDAGNDINCRCYASYELMTDEEYFKKTGKHFNGSTIIVPETILDTDNLPPHIIEYTNYNDYIAAARDYKGGKSLYDTYFSDEEWGGFSWDEEERTIQKQHVKEISATIKQLNDKYPLHKESGRLEIGEYNTIQYKLTDIQRARINDEAQAQHWMNPDSGKTIIGFNLTGYTNTLAEDLQKRAEAIDAGKRLSTVFEGSPEGYAVHEYGHAISDWINQAMIHETTDAKAYWEWYKSLSKEDIKDGISTYAAQNRNEFEAECFAELIAGNPRDIAKKYGKYLEKISNGVLKF